MKILYIVHTFLPKYLGGTEVCTLELAKELKKTNKIKILCTDPLSESNNPHLIKSKFQGLEVITIKKDIRKYKEFIDTYQDNTVIEPFKKLIKEYKPDIIHYHHLMHLSLDLTRITKELKIPQILTLHDFWFQCLTHQRITTSDQVCFSFSPNKCSRCLSSMLNTGPIVNTTFNPNSFLSYKNKKQYIIDVLKKLYIRTKGELTFPLNKQKCLKIVKERNEAMKTALSNVDTIILPTKFLSTEFKKWGLRNKNTIDSSDGINIDLFKNFKKKSSKTLRFVYIGSIIPNKGLDIVLKAWPKLKEGDYSLKIYGNLQTNKRYANQIKNLSKSFKGIKFCGTFPPENIAKIYSEIDVLIVPSRWFENAPLVLRNSRLVGIPAVAAKIGSMPELIQDGQNGYLYENENPSDLAEKLNKFIEDPSLIQKLNKKLVKQKSIEENTEELVEMYKKMLQKQTNR